MTRESVVADVATLERTPTLPRLALTIQEMLARNTPTSVIQRVAGGRENLNHILHTYLRAPPQPPPSPPMPGKAKPVRTRRVARWERRAEVLRVQLDNERRLRSVQRVICDVFGVSPEALVGRSLERKLARARAAFCLLAQTHVAACGVNQITEFIGRDHATLTHYRRHLVEWMGEESFGFLYGIANTNVAAALLKEQ